MTSITSLSVNSISKRTIVFCIIMFSSVIWITWVNFLACHLFIPSSDDAFSFSIRAFIHTKICLISSHMHACPILASCSRFPSCSLMCLEQSAAAHSAVASITDTFFVTVILYIYIFNLSTRMAHLIILLNVFMYYPVPGDELTHYSNLCWPLTFNWQFPIPF